jgi:hypothetical protein
MWLFSILFCLNAALVVVYSSSPYCKYTLYVIHVVHTKKPDFNLVCETHASGTNQRGDFILKSQLEADFLTGYDCLLNSLEAVYDQSNQLFCF